MRSCLSGVIMYNFFSQDTTSFKTDLKNATCIKSVVHFDAVGSAIRKEKASSSLCAIGEAYERYALMQHNCINSKLGSCSNFSVKIEI